MFQPSLCLQLLSSRKAQEDVGAGGSALLLEFRGSFSALQTSLLSSGFLRHLSALLIMLSCHALMLVLGVVTAEVLMDGCPFRGATTASAHRFITLSSVHGKLPIMHARNSYDCAFWPCRHLFRESEMF